LRRALVRVELANDSRGRARRDDSGWQRAVDERADADNGVASDGDALGHDDAVAEKDVVTDRHRRGERLAREPALWMEVVAVGVLDDDVDAEEAIGPDRDADAFGGEREGVLLICPADRLCGCALECSVRLSYRNSI
jgi:hypothetical protein